MMGGLSVVLAVFLVLLLAKSLKWHCIPLFAGSIKVVEGTDGTGKCDWRDV
jgi:hypothetical protein